MVDNYKVNNTIEMKKLVSFALVVLVGMIAAPAVVGATHPGVERVDGFVCPVFNDNSQVGLHNPNAVEIGGGDYSIIGPNVSIPAGATNQDGAGIPGGTHASPGDSDYTAIWGN